jgi:hypothetical protein
MWASGETDESKKFSSGAWPSVGRNRRAKMLAKMLDYVGDV